jgi:apolipoprotein D and lipocalin family protein
MNAKYLLILLVFFGCKSYEELPVVSELDIEKYQGKWYEIARLPNRFEDGLDRVTATYTPRNDGKIDVLNKGYLIGKNEYKEARGIAKLANTKCPAKLKVSFFGPFYGNYWVLELDKNYQFALVGEPSRKYLWILAREKELNENIYQELIDIANSYNFNTDDIIRVNQD